MEVIIIRTSLLLSPAAWGQTSDDEALFSIAVQAYQDGLLDLSHDQLQTYLRTYPARQSLAEVSYLLGDYYYRKQDFRQAALLFRGGVAAAAARGIAR